MRALIEAVLYRIGSLLLSTLVAWIVTRQIALSVALAGILFVTHTLYYMAFRHYWSRLGYEKVPRN